MHSQFSRYKAETLQVRQRLFGTGRKQVNNSTCYPRGLRNKGLITQKTLIFSMHSHSLQDTELKVHRYINDFPVQVVERLTILRYPRRLRNKKVISVKSVDSTCTCTVLRYRHETLQVRQWLYRTSCRGLMSLRCPIVSSWIKCYVSQKTLTRHAFAQFSRYRTESSQKRQWLPGTGRGGVDDFIIPQGAQE